MTSVRKLATAIVAFALLCGVFVQPAGAANAATPDLGYSLTPSKTMPYTPCPPGGQVIECNIVIDPPAVQTSVGFRLPSGGPLLEGGGELGGYDPTDLLSAYAIPSTGGSGQTVALVEAYGYAAAESDLAKYREKYGLAACTKENGCFKKVNQKGEESKYPVEGGEVEKSWTLETALDMDMVSAACAACHITVVEANTQEPKDTAASAEEAAKLSATEISNSYGYPEVNEQVCPAKKGCSEYLSDYNHAGIPVTVSSGDSGYDRGQEDSPSWPATSPNVIAVGGTTLHKASNTRGWSETIWAASGSACSADESKPSWQTDTGCTKRTDNDVSAVADPNTPVSVYNTPLASGWVNIGGTSASAPLVAAIEAHATAATRTAAAEIFYKRPGQLFDITTGSNGACAHAYECHGEPGYDGPTGWGTPNGVFRTTGWFSRTVLNLASKIAVKKSLLSSSSCEREPENENFCFAVGHTTNVAGTEVPLRELWNGTTWRVEEVLLPAGAKSGSLSSVSCKNELLKICVAVGRYVNSSGVELPLAEEVEELGLEGVAWRPVELSTPTGAKSGSLAGVSCESANFCAAVGRYVTSAGVEQTLAERWKQGGGWTIVETVNPTGAKASSLSGVSCTAILNEPVCMAVGHDTNSSSVEVTLAEDFISSWALVTTPNPSGAKGSSLSGVTCTTSVVCTGVGRYITSGGVEQTLVERSVSGGTATISESPNPTGAKASSLASDYCSGGAEACVAVGRYVNSAGTEVTLAETLASGKWTVQETANPSGAKSSSLIGLRCLSATQCQAVGGYVSSSSGELTLDEALASGKWTVKEIPTPKMPAGNLPALSCPGTEACTAVGHYDNEAGAEFTLVEAWNGKEWSLQETPNPTGAKGSGLTAVSCASTTVCMAVGKYVNSSGVEVALAEEFAAGKWAIKETVNPTGAKSASLSGVSCASTTVCMAVGKYVNSSGVEVTLAEEFAAGKWAIKEPVNPTGAKGSSLAGVSCASTTVCMAVGHYVNEAGVEVTLAEEFAAAKWAIKEPVNPTGAKGTSLTSVSCASTTVCMAVGRYVNSSGVEVTLAEEFATAKWTVKEPPNPSGAKGSVLAGVSCGTSETCTAVGHYKNSAGVEVTLAEAYESAKWTVQTTVNPEEGKSSLAGVSCKTAGGCLASGRDLLSATESALVEEHA